MATSTRQKQTAALRRMLNFNVQPTKVSMAEPHWKVLIYDSWGQDIISPLLSVKELRDLGVTLHLLIDAERENITDVPAIYFVMPTDDNVKRICKDFQAGMYEAYYLNFISAISRQRLEDLALAAIQTNVVSQVSKVFDQYLNFISLEDDLFALRHQDSSSISYYVINRGDVKDTEIDAIMDSIVDSLFSVCVTLGTVPIIRCPRGNAAEMVAEKLNKKLRDNLRDTRNSLFNSESVQGQFSFQRPLMVLLDRNMDLATPFHHTWTYQALAHDVLDLKLNRVEINQSSDGRSPGGHAMVKKQKKVYDLNPTDKFWIEQKGSPFPTVAEAVQEALETYKAQEDEVKRLKHAMGLEGDRVDGAISMMADNTAKLTSAVSSLPELLENKRLIDMHTNIATALLEHIKARKLDLYFETEEKLMSKSTLDKSIMDIINDPEAGTPEDKIRLFIITLICGPAMTDAEIDSYCLALQAAGCETEPVQYVRRWKSYSKMTVAPSAYGGGGTKTVSMFSKLMSTASSFTMEGVKNFVVKKHNLPVTRIVDALMEMKTQSDVEDYRYFDPKLLRASDANSIPRNRNPYQEAIVFIVGGGNYIEFQNLCDYVKNKAHSRIIYGCTELLNANEFLEQLAKLGRDIS